MMVKDGFTAPLEAKKDPSTTYRLSTSWARQLVSSTEIRGSVPKRQVPQMSHVLGEGGTARGTLESETRVVASVRDSSSANALRVAHRLFGETYSFQKRFLEELHASSGASLEPLDFAGAPEASRQHITAWVDDATDHHITNLIPASGITADSRLVLADAIYFRGQWQTPFVKTETRPAPFHLSTASAKSVPTMHEVTSLAFAHTDGVTLLDVPYTGDRLVMTFVLPDTVDGLGEVERRLTSEVLRTWLAALSPHRVRVALPSSVIDPGEPLALRDFLAAAGMPLAFDPHRAVQRDGYLYAARGSTLHRQRLSQCGREGRRAGHGGGGGDRGGDDAFDGDAPGAAARGVHRRPPVPLPASRPVLGDRAVSRASGRSERRPSAVTGGDRQSVSPHRLNATRRPAPAGRRFLGTRSSPATSTPLSWPIRPGIAGGAGRARPDGSGPTPSPFARQAIPWWRKSAPSASSCWLISPRRSSSSWGCSPVGRAAPLPDPRSEPRSSPGSARFRRAPRHPRARPSSLRR